MNITENCTSWVNLNVELNIIAERYTLNLDLYMSSIEYDDEASSKRQKQKLGAAFIRNNHDFAAAFIRRNTVSMI